MGRRPDRVARVVRAALRKVFPDHWSFLLGEIALFCFVILLATGTFMTFFYVPSAAPVIYDGPVPAAPRPGGLGRVQLGHGPLVRGARRPAHAADPPLDGAVFVAVVVLHLCRVFFTGAFRRPRELNWLVGFGLLVLALAEGFTGYSLPDDLLSGTGARIAYSVLLSIPFIGPWLASLAFGGEFPTEAIIPRLFVLHVLFLPALVIGAITVHIALLVHPQAHAVPRRPGERGQRGRALLLAGPGVPLDRACSS